MSDILAIGHATIDLFLPLNEAHLRNIDHDRKELCLPYPDKLHVDDLNVSPGGNAPNTAAGLKKLGLDVRLYAHESRDLPGAMLNEHFKQSGLPLAGDLEKAKSDLSVILSYEGDRVILAHHAPSNWSWSGLPEEVEWVYLSSLGTDDFQSFHTELKNDLTDRDGVRCAYNPGSCELKYPARELEVLEAVDLLIVNREEAGELLERPEPGGTDEAIRSLAEGLSEYGPNLIVITDGSRGSWGLCPDGFFYQNALPTDVVESTGAGDSFASGCVGGLVEGKSLPEALLWGSAQAHSVMGEVGATKGLLTKEALQEILAKNQSEPERIST